ncbi:MAG TPA: DUF1707 domain-containing protein [Chloroflexota bacterium]
MTQAAWTPAPKMPSLRVGDADRRHVVEQLQRHFVDGRLTSDELSERVDQTLVARTVAELAAPLADLPPLETTEVKTPGRWWPAFTTLPGMVLVGLLGVMLLTWLIWLPGAHVAGDGAPVWSLVLLGGFFFVGKRR